MGVVLDITSLNGAANIDSTRQKTNISNLDDGKRCWDAIINMDEVRFPQYTDVKFTEEKTKLNKDGKLGKLTEDEIIAEKNYLDYLRTQIRETIPSRIEKNFMYYGLVDPSQISWKEIKKMAKYYLKAEPWLQINFCIDSTRQSVEEKVQREMLNKYVKPNTFSKETKGLYVYEGNFYKSKKKLIKATGSKNVDRKDIDTCGVLKGREIKIFQKYAKVAGGHQDNVYIEALNFVKDSQEYVDKHKDKYIFVAQLDGKYIESYITDLSGEITDKNRVFVGNSKQVINWLKKI